MMQTGRDCDGAGDDDGDEGQGEAPVGFQGVMGMGNGPLPPHTMPQSSPVAQWLQEEQQPLTQYDIDLLPRFEGLPPEDRCWLAALDMEAMDIVKLPVAIGSILRIVLKAWERGLGTRHQTVSTENVDRLPVIVADSEGLREVLSHLIQNAIKYTPDGGTIDVEGRVLGADAPAGDQAVEIVIRDSGIGIAPENLKRVFDRLFCVGDVGVI